MPPCWVHVTSALLTLCWEITPSVEIWSCQSVCLCVSVGLVHMCVEDRAGRW